MKDTSDQLIKELTVVIGHAIDGFRDSNKDRFNNLDVNYIYQTALAVVTTAALKGECERTKQIFLSCVLDYVQYFTGLAIEMTGNKKDLESYNELRAKMEKGLNIQSVN